MTSDTTSAPTPVVHHVSHPSTLSCWGDAEDESVLVCWHVRDLSHDVKSLTFATKSGRHLFHFEPGQFVTLRLPVDGVEVMRSYTVSSPPTRPYLLTITVKRQPGGVVSEWLHDNVRPGTELVVHAPLGSFSTVRHPADKYLFLAAGSGLTPMMSMCRNLIDLGSPADVVLVNSVRTPADVIFGDELRALDAIGSHLRVETLCSTVAEGEEWAGERGRLDPERLVRLVPDLCEREVFVCGPAPYMDMVKGALRAAGHDPARYHEETFTFEDIPRADFGDGLVDPVVPYQPTDAYGNVPEEVAADGGAAVVEEQGAEAAGDVDAEIPGSYVVQFTRSGRSIECGPDETVLQAAFRAGLTPPSSCSEGVCGTCKATLLEGEVDMQHNGGIRPREIKMGKVLLCSSKPLGNLSVEA
ncbi:hybrid-cluster NAD(P)-dependent oxidoreductase [uncultured Pseudokineococcus sp.]|uniref:hybrid-cluster NAD(P)-dependent oxidoreductase n=1 Tax=uncultured Pseudokineococcus sp. TaxID=1642928 RepID=UPI00261DA62F|nr:hybrid-cluster NAD(P)-dependent oxidoreductase [uncultured Pseudokineococcus sp.]